MFGEHQALPLLTHSFPPRRSSDRRAAFGHLLHRAAPREPAFRAFPDAPDRRAPTLYAVRGGRALRPGHGRPTARAEPAALGSVAASASAGRSDRRHDDDDGEPRSGKPRRRRAPRLLRHQKYAWSRITWKSGG